MKVSSTKWWQLAIVGALIASPVYANDNSATTTATDSAATASASATRAPSASAATDSAAQAAATSTTDKSESIVDRMSIKYTADLGGMTLGQLDGKAGPGANLSLVHYWSFGFKINKTLSATLSPYFSTPIRAANPDKADNLVFGDVYATLFHNNLYKNEKYGIKLAGYFRAYFPTSKNSNDPEQIGSRTEQQNGKARIRLFPSKTWMDGALTFTLDSSFYVPFRKGGLGANNASSVRDYYVFFFPNLKYQASDSLAPYVAYNAPISHYKDSSRGGNGRWDRLSDGNSFEVGVNWTGDKGLLVIPYHALGQKDEVRDTSVGLVAQYRIL